jgi:hypothetical protein
MKLTLLSQNSLPFLDYLSLQGQILSIIIITTFPNNEVVTSAFAVSNSIILYGMHITLFFQVHHCNSCMFGLNNISLYNRASVTEMAGRTPDWDRGHNLSRSQSLQNVGAGSGSAPAGDRFGNLSLSHSAIPTASEEEGLELLSSFAATEDNDSVNCHSEIDTRLLDYDSDASREPDDVSSAVDTAPTAAMDTDQAPHCPPSSEMDASYIQCRAARLSGHKDLLISVSQDESFGKNVTVQSASIGSLEDHGNLHSTFFGSRMMRGNENVNQSISSSVDPAKLCCISCDTEHNVVGKDPFVVMFSDQNFVPSLNCASKQCISIVQIENCSLLELYEIAHEMFGNMNLPEGSVFLFGSASYLGRTGTSIYARDWSEVVALCTGKWRGVRICPLIPLVITECPGTIVRELSELTNWYSNVYDSDPLGFHEVWIQMVAAMEECSTGTTTLDVMDSYKIALPSTLATVKLDRTVTFCSNNSRPVVFNGLPKDRCCELLGSLLKFLYENFRACACPESYLERADVTINQSEIRENVVTLVGASNLGYSMAHFSDPNMTIVGVTVAGCRPRGFHPYRKW